MNRFLPGALAFIALAPAASRADAPVPPEHSTVHLVFISSHSQPMAAGGMMEMGGMGGPQTPMARVGDAMVPVDAIRPIRIAIDGEFVGHAMVGVWSIKPVFVLPEGHHEFTFSMDGRDPVAEDIWVLGTGSKQYLIVRLPEENSESKTEGASSDASAVQPGVN